MNNFTKNITPFVKAESLGHYSEAFSYLENAHVLGQQSTYWHVKIHFLMLLWGLRRRSIKEAFGQVIRILRTSKIDALTGLYNQGFSEKALSTQINLYRC